MESLVLNFTSTNQDLIPNLIKTTPRNVTFNQSGWNYLVSTSYVIYPTAPTVPLRRATFHETMHSSLKFPFSAPFPPLKTFPFLYLGGAPFYLLDEMLPDS